MGFRSNEDFMTALRSLIDRWCVERRLRHLAAVLPSFIGFNALTDGWAELSSGLKRAVGLGVESLPADEWEMLQRLSRDAEKAVSRR